MTADGDFDAARAAVVDDMEAVAAELCSVLDVEREALGRRDSLALDAATSCKAALLQRLESLDAERRQFDGLDDCKEPQRWRGRWQALASLLETCHRANAVNGGIVARQLRDVRRALDVLRGAGEGAPVLYDPGGHARARAVPRPLSQA